MIRDNRDAVWLNPETGELEPVSEYYTAQKLAETETVPVLRCLRCLLDLEDDPRPARTVWSGDALCSRHLSERLALYGLNLDLEEG